MKNNVWNESIDLTSRFVAIPSENPVGTEEKMAQCVREWLQSNKLPVEMQQAGPGRPNVISRIKGKGNRPPIILLAHMDTVPAGDGWSFSPFSGEIRGARLLGRGSTDMKGGLAAAMVAFREIARSSREPAGDILLAATVDEEGADMRGIMSLINSGLIKKDMTAICTEPSGLCLCPAHKGVLWYSIEVRGKRAHAGNAHLGADSNKGAARVIIALEEKVASLPYHHELLGKCSLTVGEMSGGEKTNVVPDNTVLRIDFRAVPPLTVEEADRIIEEAAQEGAKHLSGISVMTKRYTIPRPPVETALSSPVIQSVREAYRETMGSEIRIKSFPAYTDAAMAQSRLSLSDSIVFGPGELEDAHIVDESIDIAQLKASSEIVYRSLTKLLKT